jgi:hypothetical protein
MYLVVKMKRAPDMLRDKACGTVYQIKCISIALRTSADISKCCTETQPKHPKQQAMQV